MGWGYSSMAELLLAMVEDTGHDSVCFQGELLIGLWLENWAACVLPAGKRRRLPLKGSWL